MTAMTTHKILLETANTVHTLQLEIQVIKRYNAEYTLTADEFAELAKNKLSFSLVDLDRDDFQAVIRMINNAHN